MPVHEVRKMKDRKVACPVCKKEITWSNNPFRPFCSGRCRLTDLGKWASEEYRIAGDKKLPEEEEGDENK
jgi:endogenous inhibitor of DNA gyrase (YacG/DUF329 family)